MDSSGNFGYWQAVDLQYPDGLQIRITLDPASMATLNDPGRRDELLAKIRENHMSAGLHEDVQSSPPPTPVLCSTPAHRKIPSTQVEVEDPSDWTTPAYRRVPSTQVEVEDPSDWITAPNRKIPSTQVEVEDPSDCSDVEDSQLSSASCAASTSNLIAASMKWPTEAIKYLIHLYGSFEEQLENPLNRKKDVWRKITEMMVGKGYSFTQNKVESKWRNLLASHKEIKDNRKQTGAKRKSFAYFTEMEEILAKRHDLSPPVTAGSGCPPPKKKKEDQVHPLSVVDHLSDSQSAIRRRKQRQAAADEVPVKMMSLLHNMNEERKRESEVREANKDRRAAERNAILREFLGLNKS